MAASSRIGSTIYLSRKAVDGHAGAYSETAQSLVGVPRVLWELAHGASAVQGERPVIGTNAQGLVGVDCSGPPYGPALLLPIASWHSVEGEAGIVRPLSPLSLIGDERGSLIGWRFWNRGHATRQDNRAPLQRGVVYLRRTASAATSTTWECAIDTSDGNTIVNTFTTESSASGNAVLTNRIPLSPGENVINVRFRRVTSNTVTLAVQSILIAVGAKRLHGLTFPG